MFRYLSSLSCKLLSAALCGWVRSTYVYALFLQVSVRYTYVPISRTINMRYLHHACFRIKGDQWHALKNRGSSVIVNAAAKTGHIPAQVEAGKLPQLDFHAHHIQRMCVRVCESARECVRDRTRRDASSHTSKTPCKFGKELPPLV